MKIRDAEIDDSFDLFEWRNDQSSRDMSITNKKITREEHEVWYQNSLKNPLRKLYIGLDLNEKIGICRFDYNELDNCSEVSINLNPKMRGKNLAYQFLFGSIKKYILDRPCKLKAIIKKENKASLKIFERCNFIYVVEDDNFYYLLKTQN